MHTLFSLNLGESSDRKYRRSEMTIEAVIAKRRRKADTAGIGGINDARSRKTKRLRSKRLSPVLRRLFDCCRDAFGGYGPGDVPSPRDVKKLCRVLDVMEAEDVGLSRDQQFFSPTTSAREAGDDAMRRVKCATIYSCSNFSLSLFFIPSGGVIPLHNHPGMTVFSKLLVGTLHIKSYDWSSDPSPSMTTANPPRLRLARLKSNRVFASPCKTSVLYPRTGGNIHEFAAVTPCAVLDVMGPPYSITDGRDCSYYRDCLYIDGLLAPPSLTEDDYVGIKEMGEEYVWLEEIEIEDPPIDGVEYMGPKIKVY